MADVVLADGVTTGDAPLLVRIRGTPPSPIARIGY